MSDVQLLSVGVADLAARGPLGSDLLALNNAHARELSWLAPEKLRHLVSEAFLARRIGTSDAFLLAFDQAADYDSPNFVWFRARHERFVYIDRVVVTPAARGRGHARRLYHDLFAHASSAGHRHVFCEVNLEPPNPASDAFRRWVSRKSGRPRSMTAVKPSDTWPMT
jgi:predicted GNAT superfamily acetyltransferase